MTVDFNFGNWTFTLGKDCMATGGFEYDAWDVDVDYMLIGDKTILASYLWNNLPSYQWGGKVAYSIQDHTTLALQMTTSPFGERPFVSGLYSYSAQWNGNYGPLSNIWSASAIHRQDGGFEWLVSLSQRVELGDFTLGLDWYNMVDVDYDDDCILRREMYASGKSRAFINDTPVQLSQLKAVGDKLIDIHSQHQNLMLNDEGFQLDVLDILSHHKEQLSDYRSIYRSWTVVRVEYPYDFISVLVK